MANITDPNNPASQGNNSNNRDGAVKDAAINAAVESILAQRETEAQRDAARLERNIAEVQRDEAVVTAMDEAQRRQATEVAHDVALSVAAREAEEHRVAELQASQARMNANQAYQKAAHLETERSVLRSDLANERETASRASFGFTMIISLVMATLLGLGIWYYFKSQDDQKAQTQSNMQAATNTIQSKEAARLEAAKNREAKKPIVIQTLNPPPIVIKQPVTRVEIHHDAAPAPTDGGVGGTDTTNTNSDTTGTGDTKDTKGTTDDGTGTPKTDNTKSDGATNSGSGNTTADNR